jgi:glycosyltransferase involved in cell wall biosynthesis
MNARESRIVVFISWATVVPRSKGIAEALKARDFYIEYMKEWPLIFLPIRYLAQALTTLAVLRVQQPDVVVAMNPPIILPLLTFAYCYFNNARFVIDSHTGAFTGVWRRFMPLHRLLSKRAVVTVVTNETLQREVEGWGARAIVLEDRVPEFKDIAVTLDIAHPSVCMISSFSEDEPLTEVLEAAARVEDCTFYITGKVPRKKSGLVNVKRKNVVFTDFLPEREYIQLIQSVDVLLALVTRDNTMLCGAYEAVAAEKPLVTSNWPVLKQYFCQGSLYVNNTPPEIENAVRKALEKRVALGEEMKELKIKLKKQWDNKFEQFMFLVAADGRPRNQHPTPNRLSRNE